MLVSAIIRGHHGIGDISLPAVQQGTQVGRKGRNLYRTVPAVFPSELDIPLGILGQEKRRRIIHQRAGRINLPDKVFRTPLFPLDTAHNVFKGPLGLSVLVVHPAIYKKGEDPYQKDDAKQQHHDYCQEKPSSINLILKKADAHMISPLSTVPSALTLYLILYNKMWDLHSFSFDFFQISMTQSFRCRHTMQYCIAIRWICTAFL